MKHTAFWITFGVVLSLAMVAWLLLADFSPRQFTKGASSVPAAIPDPVARGPLQDSPVSAPSPIMPAPLHPEDPPGAGGDRAGGTTVPSDTPGEPWSSFEHKYNIARIADLSMVELNALAPECHAQLIKEFDEIYRPFLDARIKLTRSRSAYHERMKAAGRYEEYPYAVEPGKETPIPQVDPDYPGQILMRSSYFDTDRNCGVLRVVRINPGDDEGVDRATMDSEREDRLARMKLRSIIDRWR